MGNQALIFIPDISGYTQFITQCNLEHSKKIVFNLIDSIIASNQMGLKLSEIEGDAVLFYLDEEIPEREQIIQQAQKTFVDFHSSLRAMTENVFCDCPCDACTTASGLTLKFIVHFGECKVVSYNGFTKLIGRDVILAHRMLKAAVPQREYILFSEQYLDLAGSKEPVGEEWVSYHSHKDQFKDFGEIGSQYIPLSPLRAAMNPQGPEVLSEKRAWPLDSGGRLSARGGSQKKAEKENHKKGVDMCMCVH